MPWLSGSGWPRFARTKQTRAARGDALLLVYVALAPFVKGKPSGRLQQWSRNEIQTRFTALRRGRPAECLP